MTDKLDFRIRVSARTPEEESKIVKAIASEFIRLGVHAVVVIADNEHINYVDGEVYNVTDNMSGLFKTNPAAPVDSYIAGHRSTH